MTTQAEIVDAISKISRQDGLAETSVPGVHLVKRSKTDLSSKRLWPARVGIIIQGEKEIILGRQIYRYPAFSYTVAPIDLPVVSRVSVADAESPFLGLLIDFDPLLIGELIIQMDERPSDVSGESQRALFGGAANSAIIGATYRLIQLLSQDRDSRILGPLVVREIFYHVLNGADGPAIQSFLRRDSKAHRISQSIYQMRSAIDENINVDELAKQAGMSRSSFFQHFNAMTSMSPIQYLKRIRLLEARRLIVEGYENSENAAYQVGYKSASQFSREYSRMFGNPPLRDSRFNHSLVAQDSAFSTKSR